MKIALVHSKFARGGGMESYLLALVKGFLRQGDEVTVFAADVDETLARETGCKVCKVGSSLPRKLREYWFLHSCRTLTQGKGFDISISLAKTSGQSIAVCGGVHLESIRQYRRTAVLRKFYDLFEQHYERCMFQRTPTIIAHSMAVARDIAKHYPIASSRVHVLYPPIDTDRFVAADRREAGKLRRNLGVEPKQRAFLFVSCGHRRKGLRELLTAFSRLDPERNTLLIAGSKGKEVLGKNIRYLGYIENMAPIYGAVDYTILASHYEPFGLVIPESLQCGTPVMVTKNVGAAELLTEQECVFFPDGTADSITAVLSRVEKVFRVAPGFAERHGLTIDFHVREIKKLKAAAENQPPENFLRC